LHSKELILVFVRLGRLVTPRLVHLLARHIEYEEQIDGVCRKQKDWNLSGKCIANAGLSHQDIFGYESGPIYQLIPEILANIGDKRAKTSQTFMLIDRLASLYVLYKKESIPPLIKYKRGAEKALWA